MTRDGSIVAVGEILWDLLPAGPLLGGAPFNVLVHLHRLGWPTRMVSAVGADDLGTRALQAVDALGVGRDHLATLDDVGTGVVDVTLDERGVPTYVIRTPAAYEAIVLTGSAVAAIARTEPRAVVFGTLAQRFPGPRAAVAAIASAAPDAVRVYDLNLRDGAWTASLVEELCRTANVVKVNEEEVVVLAAALGLAGDTAADAVRTMISRFGVRLVFVTRGEHGAEVVTSEERLSVPGHRVTVADTVGAGDAFTAGLVDGLLGNLPLEETLRRANALGAVVAALPGAVPSWSGDDLAAMLASAS